MLVKVAQDGEAGGDGGSGSHYAIWRNIAISQVPRCGPSLTPTPVIVNDFVIGSKGRN
jgi:hypothetical protein